MPLVMGALGGSDTFAVMLVTAGCCGGGGWVRVVPRKWTNSEVRNSSGIGDSETPLNVEESRTAEDYYLYNEYSGATGNIFDTGRGK